MSIFRVRNASGSEGTWAGETLADGETFDIIGENNLQVWRGDGDVMLSVAQGNLIVNNGSEDILNVTDAWRYLSGDTLPKSKLDNTKVAVHSSPKPDISGITTYAVWTGAGDDPATGDIGEGDLLHFESEVGVAEKIIDVHFSPVHGRIWLHEGYVKFNGAGIGDNMSAEVIATATPLQQSVALDLVVTDNWITFAPGGPGTGTHGFADPTKISLVGRTFSKDGDWDYDGVDLTPNFAGNGEYKISDIDRIAHRFINKIPCYDTASNYFTMSSDETSELPANYFLRVKQNNVSNTVWHASIIIEIYRQRTMVP